MSTNAITHRHPLIQQLIKAFGIPPECKGFTIRAAVDKVVTVDVEYMPTPGDEETIPDIKKYCLKELNDDEMFDEPKPIGPPNIPFGKINFRKFNKKAHNLTVDIKITKEFKARLWLAKNILRLACFVVGCGLKINESAEFEEVNTEEHF